MVETSSETDKKKNKIAAMCISPNNEEIAFYCSKSSTIYIYSSELEKTKKIKLSVNNIQQESMDNEITKEDIQEYQSLLAYDNKHFQFLFCGTAGVAL